MILDALPVRVRRELERMMEKPETRFRSRLMQNLLREGQQQGLEQGRKEAREALRAVVRTMLAERSVVLDADREERLRACDELETLREWVRRAATARSAHDVFGA